MIAFASAVTKPDQYWRFAEPGMRLAAEPNSLLVRWEEPGTIFERYNAIMEHVAGREDLEALVLLHQDSEIVDPTFCRELRAALEDPDVAVVGCVGAIGVRSIAWWEGSVTWASFVHRYGGPGEEFPSLTWDPENLPPYARLGEVDTVDGFVLCLSPWAVRNLRFDEALESDLHGYDFDFCLQARAAGKKVVTANFRVIHNHSLELASDPGGWIQAHVKVAEKWDGKMPGVGVMGGDWKQRARRAEAERGAARAQAVATQLQTQARRREHEHALAEATGSIGWRLTAPLRVASRLNASLRRRRRPGTSPLTGP